MVKRGGLFWYLSLFIVNPLIIIAFQNFTIAKDNITMRMTQIPQQIKGTRSPASTLGDIDLLTKDSTPRPAPKYLKPSLE